MEHLGPLCAIYVSSNLDFKAAADPELDVTFAAVMRSVDSSSVNIFSRAPLVFFLATCNLYLSYL